jgi:hypothetical protein
VYYGHWDAPDNPRIGMMRRYRGWIAQSGGSPLACCPSIPFDEFVASPESDIPDNVPL